MKTWFAGTVLLAVLLAGATFAAAAPSPSAVAPSADGAPAWTYTLYGDALKGWGSNASTITTPGPTLTVTTGEALDLHLISNDGVTHTWFVDLNNNSALDPSETSSGYFNATTGPIWYNTTVTFAPDTYTYRCSFHPGAMWGELVVMAKPAFTLWGSAAVPNGWGFTSTTITQPGPTLNVSQGQTVTIDLFSADGVDHDFYVDFAHTNSTSGNTVSAVFNGTHPVRFTFVANQAGDFLYACGIHGPGVMKGTLHVASGSAPPASPPDYTTYAAVIVVIVIVALVAVIVIRRRPRSPPAQPPAAPPSPPQG